MTRQEALLSARVTSVQPAVRFQIFLLTLAGPISSSISLGGRAVMASAVVRAVLRRCLEACQVAAYRSGPSERWAAKPISVL